MIRVGFVIGEYPPEERRLREDVAKSYGTDEIEIGILSVGASPYGPMGIPSIEAVAPLFHQAYIQAEKEGYDAVVPLGMLDLGVEGGRCLVDIPVIGPSEATYHVASFLGDRFGLVCYEPYVIPRIYAKARYYGMAERIAGVGTVSMPKADMTANRDQMTETFVAEARKLIEENGAQVIIPHGISQCPIHIKPDWLSEELGVPVVEGFGAPIRLAAMLAGLGYKHSRIRYPLQRI
ncbi:MAG TPA: aspartate/glutamate racemase family protein [Alphaproteobacteria bacterium]|nr:aspartate/glutamate racemase family protein [Alphaproteobacteria bacterium]